MLDIFVDDDHFSYLKPRYLFILTLILLYVDTEIDTELKPSENEIMQFFYDEFDEVDNEYRTLDELSCFLALLKPYIESSGHKIIQEYAIPLFIDLLADINLLESCIKFFEAYILKKEALYIGKIAIPGKGHILYENSIFGSFVICCSTIINSCISMQEKVNLVTLREMNHLTGTIFEYGSKFEHYKTNSHTYTLIKNQFNIDFTSEKPYKFYLNNVLLQEMLPAEEDSTFMLKMINVGVRNDGRNRVTFSNSLLQNVHNKNYQFSQDVLFTELDSCETQYQLIMIILAMVKRHLYFNDLSSVSESLVSIIDSSRFNKNRFLLMLSYVLFYILLSKYPEMKQMKSIKPSIRKQLQDLASDFNVIFNLLGPEISKKFLCGKALNMILLGDFNESFKVIKEIGLLNLQLQNSGTSEKQRIITQNSSIFPISYMETLNTFYCSLNCFHLKEQSDNSSFSDTFIHTPLTVDAVYQCFLKVEGDFGFRCNTFILDMYKKVILDKCTLSDKEILKIREIEIGYNTSRDEAYMIHYILINNMIELSCIETAINSIERLQAIIENSFYWKFEFNLLKCVVHTKFNKNRIQVLGLYDELFFKNKKYYEKIDRYKKLLVQVHYNNFKLESGLERTSNYTSFYDDLKYEIARFPDTRLSKLWNETISV